MIDELKAQLNKYGTILQIGLYDEDKCLEIKCKNSTGRSITYQNIVNNFITPFFPHANYKFQEGHFKGTFCKTM